MAAISKNFFRHAGYAAAILAPLLASGAQAGMAISAKATKNVSCSEGVCSATARNAVLNVDELAGMLASGDVTLASGSQAEDIQVDAALSWVSTSRLTFDSYRSIAFDRPVVVAGTGAMTITVNDGGTGGDFAFRGKGHIEFWDQHSSLIIAGHTYKLVRKLSQLQHFIKKRPDDFFALARDYNAQKDATVTHVFIRELDGTVEGLGNKISNFSMHSQYNHGIGFFLENHGTIRDLALVDLSVTGKNSVVGGLAARNFGTIRNVSVSGQVLGDGPGSYMGGLVAYNTGAISFSHVSASVDGSAGYTVGGLVGFSFLSASSITNSSATGAVTAGEGEFGGGRQAGWWGRTTEPSRNPMRRGLSAASAWQAV